AVAVVASRGFLVMRRDFDRLLDTYPDCARGAIRYLCRRLRETTDQMESIALFELDARLARFFLATLRQIHGDDLPDEARLAAPLSRGQPPALPAATRPKITRAIAPLEEQAPIARTGAAIDCDVERLQDLAEPLES